MSFAILWIASAIMVFGLGYSFGYQAGFQRGTYRGFQGALRRAIQVEKPLNLLHRILVARDEA